MKEQGEGTAYQAKGVPCAKLKENVIPTSKELKQVGLEETQGAWSFAHNVFAGPTKEWFLYPQIARNCWHVKAEKTQCREKSAQDDILERHQC